MVNELSSMTTRTGYEDAGTETYGWRGSCDGQGDGVRPLMDGFVRYTKRCPRARQWILARFDARRTEGLALTVLVAMAVGSVWLMVGLTCDVLDHGGIVASDPRAGSWIVGHRVSGVTEVLRVATFLGSNWVLLPVLAVSCVIFRWRRRSWWPAADITVVHLSATISYSMIKNALHRPRPAVAHWLTAAGGWSFPSGHATQAAAAWGILTVLAWSHRPVRTKIAIGAGSAAIILVVAFSRWYLGVHWLTDVLAGMTLGIAILSLWGVVRTIMITRVGKTVDTPPDRLGRSVDQDPRPPGADGVT